MPFLPTHFNAGLAQFSPDGRWVAYNSNESGTGTVDIYVRPFSPDASGGVNPRWRPDGKQLFYANIGLGFMAVDIDTSKGFQFGTPRRLFAAPPPLVTQGGWTSGGFDTSWDVAPYGKKFLYVTTPSAGRPESFTVMLNWEAGMKK
jgi:Tol biopolymer transport system component